ncbi:CatB-related O-acetyltransferase [Roseomonas sp. E05]|nr:CatB-related O-acetyltransferase [Roseomonas sp. E05]MDJ0386992.1 CatB-related O-acetyltransferase [Roseomonas sp. E05]
MKINLTEAAITWLRDRRVFFENKLEVRRLRPGQIIHFKDDTEVEPHTGFLSGNALCEMGAFSYSWSHLPPGLRVGRYCSIASDLSIPRPRHPLDRVSTSSFMYDRNFSIIRSHVEDTGKPFHNAQPNPQKALPVIGNDVWIGAGCTLMPGIAIGDGAVIAAGAVVTRSVEPYTIVGGNPAKPIRLRFPVPVVARLMASKWWRYSFTDFADLPLSDPEAFAERILALGDTLQPYEPERIRLRDLQQFQEGAALPAGALHVPGAA